MWQHVRPYVAWQRELRKARRNSEAVPAIPELVPLSINLDLTTACNYACDHCIDWHILNKPIKYEDEDLRASMREMAARGLKSVILIGGGEPTLYPKFVPFVQLLKELGLQVAVVTNGSRNDKILEIAPFMTKGDWVRLSLDSGSNDVFQKMHKPSRKTLTLDEICAWIPKIHAACPDLDLGYSFVITWKGATNNDEKVIENIHEIMEGTKRARDARFSYISFKPFLERATSGSEEMHPENTQDETLSVVDRIRMSVDEAKKLEQPGFRVLESTNLRMLMEDSWRDYTDQAKVCHMQVLRQVLNPHGTYNCPAYRGVNYAEVGSKDAYKDTAAIAKTSEVNAQMLDNFDASERCAGVTCLYNGTNKWLDALIDSDQSLDTMDLSVERNDWFL